MAIVWAEAPYQVAWKAQIGTPYRDRSYSVAADASGYAYIVGTTAGDLGQTNAGGYDAFLSRFDSGGSEIWTSLIGTSGYELSYSVAVDSSGNAYLSGYTSGDLDGANAGGYEAFVSKFDSSGNETWTTQIGSSRDDWGYGIALDASGNVYICGETTGDLDGANAGSKDAFVSKFRSDGNEVWTTQIGSSDYDGGQSVTPDGAGNVYITGTTYGDLDGAHGGLGDVFVSKFNSEGNEVWTTQFSTSSDDFSRSVALDAAGNVYISGVTNGDLGGSNAGLGDAYLRKLDSDGNEVWTSQIGSSDWDISYSVALDASGNVYIGGRTRSDFAGTNAGDWDGFVTKFDSAGNEIWTNQIGTSDSDWGWRIALDASGNVYLTGSTTGDCTSSGKAAVLGGVC